MIRRKSGIAQGGRLAISLQDLGQRLSFVILLCASIALLVAGRADNERMEAFRASLSDFTAPLLEISSRPVQMLRSNFAYFDQYFNTVEENRSLRKELERLQAWQALALKLQNENKEFRSLLNAQELPATPYISARVIGDLGSPFVRTMLINAGKDHGVMNDMPVVGADGLIGRVVSSGKKVARVLLLSDLNSRVPVRFEASGYQSVLAGDNEVSPQLLYLPLGVKVNVGDRLVTSGHGGVFPPGIPIGTVSSVTASNSASEIRVKAFADEHRIGFVRILQNNSVEVPPGTTRVNPVTEPPVVNPQIQPASNEGIVTKRGQ